MIKKALTLSLIAVILLAVPVLAVVAYEAPYTITENASVGYDMFPAIGLSNNQWMADNGFMNSSANDTRIETLGGLEKPHLVTDNMTLTAVPVPANSQTNLYFTTGNSELATMDIILGWLGLITTADNATLELSDNFTIEHEGWVDTDYGSNKHLVYREDGIRTYVSNTVSENITSALLDWQVPTGFTDPDSDWTDEAKAYDNSTATYAASTIGADSWSSNITFTTPAILTNNIRYWAQYGAAKINKIDLDAYYNGAWHDVTEKAFVNEAWEENDLGDFYAVTEIRFRLYNDDPGNWGGRIYEVAFHGDDVSVTATGVSSGEYAVLTTLTASADGWISPTGFVDSSGQWANEANAYDGNTATGTVDAGRPPLEWTPYLELTLTEPVYSGKVRFWFNNGWCQTIDTDVFYSDAWHDVYEGGDGYGAWVEKDIPGGFQLVEKARVRLYNNGAGAAENCYLYEFAFEERNFQIYIDGTIEDCVSAPSGNVTDTSDNWTFLENNVMPYADNISFTIGGTQQLLYEPTSMIIGTDLPDRAGTAQNGVITWGANPAGVSVTLGSMVSEEQPTPGIIGEEPAQDILPEVEVTDWYIEPAVGGALLTNPMRPFVTLLSDNSTLTEIQSWRLLGLALVLMVTVSTAKGVGKHQGITMIAAGCGFGVLVALTVFPMWSLVFAIGMFIGGLVMERSPSL